MDRCRPVDTPLVVNLKLSKDDGAVKIDEGIYRSLIGCLLYLTATRPDLMFTTSLLSRFMRNPSEVHLKVAKRVLRYIKGSFDLGVWFKKSENFQLVRYSDSDWAGCIDDMRSTSGYAFFLNLRAICWLSKKQDTIAQSTTEAEYISTAATVNQAIWLRKILEDLKQT
ncbi:secreted RxLR effector protein 161-like [Pistacia vera]|uniref:secreted RxLR effector protein 161-like n=1 Tax=Pistacia vera TaxID=55513 RepID=UPI001262EEC1|nr:secreted RxLR effector protein 161-like [Pistacia vera]